MKRISFIAWHWNMRTISTSWYQGPRDRPKKMFLLVQPLHKKPYFFANVLKRWSFKKSCTGIWSFLYNQERWCFFSPKIWPYFFRGKWKMIFLKKSTWKYDIFSKYSEKVVFPKKSHWNMVFLLSSGNMAFLFPENVIFFLPTENER